MFQVYEQVLMKTDTNMFKLINAAISALEFVHKKMI